MKFNSAHLQQRVIATAVVAAGIIAAIVVGHIAGSGQSQSLVKICGALIAIIGCLWLRARIWMLIPIFWSLQGQIPQLKGLPAHDVVTVYACGVFLTLKALKVVRLRPTYNLLDVAILVNLLYLLTVFIRNPVGTSAFGSEKVGGRPYFEIISAVMAYWIMAQVTITPKLAIRLPWLMICGDLLSGAFDFLSYHFPSTAPVIARFYTGIAPENYNDAGVEAGPTEGREQYLASIGAPIVQCLCANYPVLSLLNPLLFVRFFIFIFAIFCCLKSGHRLAVLDVACTFLLSSYFRRGFYDILRLAAFGVPLLAMLLVLQGNVLQLPPPAQRALSFLPAKWDPAIVAEGEDSVEWRHTIWRNVWNSNKYITNWWFGDGFGLTKEQLAENNLSENGQENATINGDYHSGPLSAIHVVGYVGTVLFYLLTIGSIIFAWKVVYSTKHTAYFPIALFIGVHAIYVPFIAAFLTGSFHNDMVGVIFNIGMLKLTARSLEKSKLEEETASSTAEAFKSAMGSAVPV